MKIEIRTGAWAEMQAAAQAIRYAVFVIEQKVPVELEWDEMDAVSLHALAYDENGISMGTGRLLPSAPRLCGFRLCREPAGADGSGSDT